MKILKKNWLKWVRAFMIKSVFFKLREFKNKQKLKILLKYQAIESYINNKKYLFKLESHRVFDEYQIKFKIWKIFELLFNIIFTGIVINYAVENRNMFSYGLIVTLVIYYLDIVVQIIKKPYIKDVDTNSSIFIK